MREKKKGKRQVLGAAALALTLALCAAAALALAGCGPRSGGVAFLYTSDMHGRIMADEDAIGLDTIAALAIQTPDSLLVDGGDFLHGSPAATLSEGEDVVRLMKQAGYVAAAVGNHEFSYGLDVLEQRAAQAGAEPDAMPFLSANIYKADGELLFKPWLTFKRGGLKVGVFGVTTADTAFQAAPSAVAGLEFRDPVACARQAVEQLQARGCDIIVALAHLGSDATAPVKGYDLAEQVQGLHAVIDAHSHVTLDERINGIPVVAAGEYGQHIGRLVLVVEKDGRVEASNVLMDKAFAAEETAPNAAITAALADVQAAWQQQLEEVVGGTPVDLEAEKEVVRTAETNLGNLTADMLRLSAGADVGLMNAGCIRATIPAGDITMGQVLAAFPYSNIVVTKALSGTQLYQVMEHAVGLLPEADGRFMQVSGLVVRADASRPAGSRITGLFLADGTPVDRAADYTVATNDYIAAGGDDYPVFAGLPELTLGRAVEEVFIEYLGEVDWGGYAPGAPERILLETT